MLLTTNDGAYSVSGPILLDSHLLFSVLRDDELDVIGQYDNCAWLQVKTAQGKEGWVSGDPQYVTLNVGCGSIPTASYRPRTGVIRDKVTHPGLGKLTVKK